MPINDPNAGPDLYGQQLMRKQEREQNMKDMAQAMRDVLDEYGFKSKAKPVITDDVDPDNPTPAKKTFFGRNK